MSIEELQKVKVRVNLDPAFRAQFLKNPLKFLLDYDLTEDEKRQIVLPNFSWLIKHKLAALSYPESHDALNLLWKLGIRALINLAEEPIPAKISNDAGLLIEHFPVVDFTAPTLHQVEEVIAMIHICLDRNMPVAVNCIAGLGRTGTILACYLVGERISADEAISSIRKWRPGSIEMRDQEVVIYEYEFSLKAKE